MAERGTYTLVIELAEAATVRFGARGEYDLERGWYAYTGSAFGPGGFARIDRHRSVAAGENDARHWHVDYLLGHPAASVVDAVRSPGLDAECAISARIEGDPLAGLGASDCDCAAHLRFAPHRGPLRDSIERAHAAERL